MKKVGCRSMFVNHSGEFNLINSIKHLKKMDPDLKRLFDSYPLFYDVTTVMGRSFLANHLAILAVHTSSQNGKNKLSCNTDRCN